MLRFAFACFLMLAPLLAPAQSKDIPVFVSGEEGHKSYRIPAILDLPNGDILAFAEGRVHGAADFGDVNIVMKRSRDKGKTWSGLQTVVDYDTLQAGNAAPVMDLTDPAYPNGRLFLFYNTGNAHEHEVRSAKGWREVWYITSIDNGQTWSAPVNITAQVHRPQMPAANPAYTFTEDWRAYANTPGHAIQLKDGKYKGRIYVAANHSEGKPKNNAEDYFAHGFYTDDHGKTFKISATVPESGGNEAMAVEITNNRLMMNIRNQQGDVRSRIVSISSDGGATWDTTYFDAQLPDPVNQGSILALGKKKGKTILAFCNAADPKRRDNLTLRISYDEGKTWPVQHVIAKSPDDEKDYAAYSDLVQVGKKEVGVLYEKNGYRRIVFTTLKWK
ncbi:sialidase family protein [Pontibacter ramchanderi]|uniref:exo-alpha-sialidase n=1 Tax=Pontibacter ramchanderi TaxID=1179743 RepID=A0A2N3U869_9BACT|nr:sialidase family protein [Pontibacter ramchanderi]PKV62950.1 sialidase-1 [Pontibacter ramchanderi]